MAFLPLLSRTKVSYSTFTPKHTYTKILINSFTLGNQTLFSR